MDIDIAEHLGDGDGTTSKCTRSVYRLGFLSSRSGDSARIQKYSYVHPRPGQASVHASKNEKNNACSMWMIDGRILRGMADRGVSIGEDGSDEV